jgi:F0F1-type ATP synthase assembly protein I
MTGTPDDPKPSVEGSRKASEKESSGVDFGAIPFQLAFSLLAGVYGGEWLDKKLGSAPWLLITGVLLGAGLSFYSIYEKLSAVQARDDADRKARRKEQP